jgi:tRNA(Ile)-lysidine synthetase-like protein
MRDENDWLEGVVSGLLARCRANDKTNGLTISALVQLPIAARRRVLRMWLASSNVKMERVDFEAIDGIERLLPRAGGMKVVELTGGWRVVRRYDNLAIERAPEGSVPSFEAQLNVGGETLLPEHGMRVFVKRGRGIAKARGGGVGEFPAEASLSASAVRGSRVILRSWRHGDRIKPMGMAGSKKLQDVFVDEKVPRDLRCHVPVIECRGEVVWVPGYRVARGWEVRPNEERLSIRIEQI